MVVCCSLFDLRCALFVLRSLLMSVDVCRFFFLFVGCLLCVVSYLLIVVFGVCCLPLHVV